jgi:hypothetical protein
MTNSLFLTNVVYLYIHYPILSPTRRFWTVFAVVNTQYRPHFIISRLLFSANKLYMPEIHDKFHISHQFFVPLHTLSPNRRFCTVFAVVNSQYRPHFIMSRIAFSANKLYMPEIHAQFFISHQICVLSHTFA